MGCCESALCIINRSFGTKEERFSPERIIGFSTNREVASPKFILGGSQEAKYDHPTQKPLELMRRPILNHTKRGDVVYDPFLGSGTTMLAAEVTGRVCQGIDLDPRYVDVAVLRWQEFTGQTATLATNGGTFEQVKAARAQVAA